MIKQGQSLLDFVLTFPGAVMRKPSVSNDEAECLYKIWREGEKDEYGHIVVPHGLSQTQVASLNSKGMINTKSSGLNGKAIEITKKGKGVIKNIILHTEKSAFDNSENEKINYEIIADKSESNIKTASSKKVTNNSWFSSLPWN